MLSPVCYRALQFFHYLSASRQSLYSLMSTAHASATTVSMMTFSIITLGVTTLSITTFGKKYDKRGTQYKRHPA
jgi:hypothetical protein